MANAAHFKQLFTNILFAALIEVLMYTFKSFATYPLYSNINTEILKNKTKKNNEWFAIHVFLCTERQHFFYPELVWSDLRTATPKSHGRASRFLPPSSLPLQFFCPYEGGFSWLHGQKLKSPTPWVTFMRETRFVSCIKSNKMKKKLTLWTRKGCNITKHTYIHVWMHAW